MIALSLAMLIQSLPASAAPTDAPAPVLTGADPCIALQGRGRAVIDDQRFSGRELTRAVAQRIPAGRPLFVRFANDRARNDIEGVTAVLAGAVNAPSIVIVESCELPAGDIAQ